MPTYSYACTECDHRFDAVQSFSDDSLTTCPECQGRLRKVFNAVGVVFKGGGFYRTDSRAGSSSVAAKSESGGSSSGESGSSGSGSSGSGSSDSSSSGSSSSGKAGAKTAGAGVKSADGSAA